MYGWSPATVYYPKRSRKWDVLFWLRRQLKSIQHDPRSLIKSSVIDASIKSRFALSLTRFHGLLGHFLRQVHGPRKPVDVVNCAPDLLRGFATAALHFSEGAAHYGELKSIDAERSNSYNCQDRLNPQRQYFKQVKFPPKLSGWILLVCGYICGLMGYISLLCSGLQWGWRRRVFWGVCAWSVACWLAVHGLNLIFELSTSYYAEAELL